MITRNGTQVMRRPDILVHSNRNSAIHRPGRRSPAALEWLFSAFKFSRVAMGIDRKYSIPRAISNLNSHLLPAQFLRQRPEQIAELCFVAAVDFNELLMRFEDQFLAFNRRDGLFREDRGF